MKVIMSLGCIALLLVASPAFAQQQPGQIADRQEALSASAAIQSNAAETVKKPFATLFRAPDITRQLDPQSPSAAEARRAVAPNPEIICGLTVWRVDESKDARIIAPMPKPRVDAKIRRISPGICLSTPDPSR
jgi:hypothetical protein